MLTIFFFVFSPSVFPFVHHWRVVHPVCYHGISALGRLAPSSHPCRSGWISPPPPHLRYGCLGSRCGEAIGNKFVCSYIFFLSLMFYLSVVHYGLPSFSFFSSSFWWVTVLVGPLDVEIFDISLKYITHLLIFCCVSIEHACHMAV